MINLQYTLSVVTMWIEELKTKEEQYLPKISCSTNFHEIRNIFFQSYRTSHHSQAWSLKSLSFRKQLKDDNNKVLCKYS
jgi:hypothetical protein